MSTVSRIAAAMIVWSVLCGSAVAQGVGMRSGASFNPGQFYFGGHVETGAIADEWRFRPNVEIGIGDDSTLVGINVEFVYVIPSTREWSLYAGGGPALNIVDSDAATESEGGLNVLAGLMHVSGLFGEVKFGALDSPRVKMAVGYTFRWR